MVVHAGGVRLPDFQHRIVDGCALAIEHTKRNPRALALCLRACNASHAVFVGCQLDLKEWADRL
jgi:hypothetical protein